MFKPVISFARRTVSLPLSPSCSATMPILLSVDNFEESVSPPTILTVLFNLTAAVPVSPVYTMPSSRVATVAPPTVTRLIELPLTSSAAVPALIVTGEPSAVFRAMEPSAPLIATAEPSAPFTVMELSVPVVPASVSAALPKVMLSASFTS